MSDIKINRVKIVKGKTLEVGYIRKEKNGSTTKVPKEEHDAEIHKDLVNAFAGLNIHLGILAEFIPSADIEDLENVNAEVYEDFRVTSYSIGGDEDDEGIVLTGGKKLKSG